MSGGDVVVLWRPVGPEELTLIRANGMRAFPPRLLGQPIFYPVTTEEYAVKIARDWNVRESGAGFVTRFAVRQHFLMHTLFKRLAVALTASIGYLPRSWPPSMPRLLAQLR